MKVHKDYNYYLSVARMILESPCLLEDLDVRFQIFPGQAHGGMQYVVKTALSANIADVVNTFIVNGVQLSKRPHRHMYPTHIYTEAMLS